MVMYSCIILGVIQCRSTNRINDVILKECLLNGKFGE